MTKTFNHAVLDFSHLSNFIGGKFKEEIDWKIVIKMLISENILRVEKRNNKNKHEEYKVENERKFMIDILKKGLVSKKIFNKLNKAVETDNKVELLKIYTTLYNFPEKYLKPYIEVKYYYDKNKSLGRVYPEKSLSLCCMRRGLRHILSNGIYTDIDMVNCHFQLADEIFNKPEIQFPLLHDYVLRRKNYLQLLCNHFNEGLEYMGKKPLNIVDDYDMLKECFLRQLYYGKYESWVKDYDLPIIPPPEWLENMIQEFGKIAEIVKTENPDLLDFIEKNTLNINGSVVSWFLQEHERKILELLFEFLKKSKVIKKNYAVLCFDGIMVLNDNKRDYENILKKATEYVLEKYGINIELKTKPFDNLDYMEELNNIIVDECDNEGVIIVDNNDDIDCALQVIEEYLKDDMVYCNGVYYLKSENKWICSPSEIDSYLLHIIQNANIYYTDINGCYKPYGQSFSKAKNIRDTIKSEILRNYCDNKFGEKLINSTIGKICYKDGVLFLAEKKFRLWNDEYFNKKENEIFTPIIIEMDFADTWNNRNSEKMIETKNTIKNDLFEKILGEQTTLMLQFYYRAMCGFYEDKDWGLWLGERNCGKGCINELLLSAFGNYVTNLPSNCLIQSKFNSKDVKENSWLMDIQYNRLTLIQEFKKSSDIIVDGVAIKSITSGGDRQKARKNYQDEVEFFIGSKIMIMANDFPKIEPTDCLSTLIQYNSGKQFKSKNFIENRTREINEEIKEIDDADVRDTMLKELELYLEADDNIKTKCKSADWAYAFPLLLMDNAINSKLEPCNDKEDLMEGTNVNKFINTHFIFGNGKEFKIKNKELKDLFETRRLGISFLKFKNMLIARGAVEYKSMGVRGLKYIKININQKADTETI